MNKEDLMTEILSNIYRMAAIGVGRDTIRFYVLHKVASADWKGFEKVMFMGAIEEALDRAKVK